MKGIMMLAGTFVAMLMLTALAPSASETTGAPALQPVNSAALRAVAYQEQTGNLTIQFADGRIYVYAKVPPEIHAGLMTTPWKGGYFNRNIRRRFSARPVAPVE